MTTIPTKYWIVMRHCNTQQSISPVNPSEFMGIFTRESFAYQYINGWIKQWPPHRAPVAIGNMTFQGWPSASDFLANNRMVELNTVFGRPLGAKAVGYGYRDFHGNWTYLWAEEHLTSTVALSNNVSRGEPPALQTYGDAPQAPNLQQAALPSSSAQASTAQTSSTHQVPGTSMRDLHGPTHNVPQSNGVSNNTPPQQQHQEAASSPRGHQQEGWNRLFSFHGPSSRRQREAAEEEAISPRSYSKDGVGSAAATLARWRDVQPSPEKQAQREEDSKG